MIKERALKPTSSALLSGESNFQILFSGKARESGGQVSSTYITDGCYSASIIILSMIQPMALVMQASARNCVQF